MNTCDRLRPLLYRIAEGESTPDEAMLVGRHVPDCTTCRILLAREQRLARMLEEELDDLPVGDDFARSVMATLPDGPPPGSDECATIRRRRRWRGLKLAGFFGGLFGGSLLAWQQLSFSGSGGGMTLASPSLDRAEALAQGLTGLLRLALVTFEALQALTARLSLDLPAFSSGTGLLGLFAALLLASGLAAATVVVVAARVLLRPSLQQ